MQTNKIIAIIGLGLGLSLQTLAQNEFYGFSSPKSYSIVSSNVAASKMPVSLYIKTTVNPLIDAWQQRTETEKNNDYFLRVNEQTRLAKTQSLTDETLGKLKNQYTASADWHSFLLSDYFAEKELFVLSSPSLGIVNLPVPASDASAFKLAWNTLIFSAQDYAVVNDKLVLAKLEVINPATNKVYKYDSHQSTYFSAASIPFQFRPLEVNYQQTPVATSTQNIPAGLSDVDVNIPVNPQTNSKTFVVIIANGKYQKEDSLAFALNDGKVFKEYCEKILGIPPVNIHYVPNASFGNITAELKWINDVTNIYNGLAKVLFYYNGYGMTNDIDRSAYLLPVDGSSDNFEVALKLDDVFARLSAYPTQGISVFLDASLSAVPHRYGTIANNSYIRRIPKQSYVYGNTVVFTAASNDELANPYKEKQHGLFTYFLLKKLQDSRGELSLGELNEYLRTNVMQQSVVINQKVQTPQVVVSPALQGVWNGMKVR